MKLPFFILLSVSLLLLSVFSLVFFVLTLMSIKHAKSSQSNANRQTIISSSAHLNRTQKTDHIRNNVNKPKSLARDERGPL